MPHSAPPRTSRDQDTAEHRFGFDEDKVLLGEGGSGSTHKGWIKGADGQRIAAALKYSNFPDDPQRSSLHSARREYMQFGRLRHPHIVRYLRFFLHEGWPVVASELIPGHTLQKHADERAKRGTNTDDGWLDEVINWCHLICGALVYLEAGGVVHRDIKPGNIMIHEHLRDERNIRLPVLIDFGVGKNTVRVSGMHSSVGNGSVIGTPQFAAPEQFRSNPTNQSAGGMPDPSADIYALGVTIAYALCPDSVPSNGQMPETPDDFKKRRPVLNEVTIPWKEVRDMLDKMTQVAAAARPDAMEVRRLCEDILGEYGSGRPPERAGLTDSQPPTRGELPDFAPAINGVETATTLLSRTALACYADKDEIDLFSGDTLARCTYPQAKEIVSLINKEHENENAMDDMEYRLPTSDEWCVAAGQPLKGRLLGRRNPVFKHMKSIEMEWLADTTNTVFPDCKRVAYLDSKLEPVLDIRHREWPKGVIRLIRAPKPLPAK